MENLFEYSSFYWVRYERYALRKARDGILYITPADNVKPVVYTPFENKEQMVLDALNVGMCSISRKSAGKIQKAVLNFVTRYGLLGLMTALPTTPYFMDYESVYLPRNHFIKEEQLTTEAYLSHFFPFEKLDVSKSGTHYDWNIERGQDMKALALTFADQPTGMSMSFQRPYAERYDWVILQFRDLAYNLLGAFLYYEDYKRLDDTQKALYRQSVSAFGSVAPLYHVSLLDRPVIVWDFYSLATELQMMSNIMLADKEHPMKLCRNCMNAFIADNPADTFCCQECEDRYKTGKKQQS